MLRPIVQESHARVAGKSGGAAFKDHRRDHESDIGRIKLLKVTRVIVRKAGAALVTCKRRYRSGEKLSPRSKF